MEPPRGQDIGAGRETTQAVEDRAAESERPGSFGLVSTRNVTTARPSSPHSTKFRLATGLLLGVGLAALVLAVALAARPASSTPGQAWSDWTPSTGGKLGATEIAEHVAPYYRLSTAAQLDVVTLINLANPTAQGTTTGSGLTVAVNTGSSAHSTSSLSLLDGSTIAYNLCGTRGRNCQLPGTPSSARMLLLRREALELALYTFKYVSGTENVICVLPPGYPQVASTLSSSKLSPTLPSAKATASGSKPVTVAVVFRREELQPWLNQPLSSTLSPIQLATSELALWQKTQEAGLVDEITAETLFSEQIEAEQTGGSLLVLNQLPAQ